MKTAKVKPIPIKVRKFYFPSFPIKKLSQYQFLFPATPEQMTVKVPPDAFSSKRICDDAFQSFEALLCCGKSHYDAIALLLSMGLARLRDFALAGDIVASAHLGSILNTAVADLAEVARRKPEVVRPWSRTKTVMPVLTGKNVGHRTRLVADLEAFDVGAASAYTGIP